MKRYDTTSRITRIAIIVPLVSAITTYEIYTMPFRYFGTDNYWHPAILAGNILAILFLLSPLLALFFYKKKSNACYFWLGFFALPAFAFGATPIPFLDHLYSNDHVQNTIVIASINIIYVCGVCYLYAINKLNWQNHEGAKKYG